MLSPQSHEWHVKLGLRSSDAMLPVPVDGERGITTHCQRIRQGHIVLPMHSTILLWRLAKYDA